MSNPKQSENPAESSNAILNRQADYFFVFILSLIFGIFGIPQFYLKNWKSGLLRLIVNALLILGAITLNQTILLPVIFSYPIIESLLYLIYEDTNAPKKLFKGQFKPHKKFAAKQRIAVALAALGIGLYFSMALTQTSSTTISIPQLTHQETTVQAPDTSSQTGSDNSTNPTQVSSNVTIKFIDVGQGDAILIALPQKTVLIDAGPTGSAPKITSTLHELGRNKIDYLIATHPDEDHIGGMVDIISDTKIDTIYAPNKTNNTATYRKFLTAIQNKNMHITLAEAGTIIDQTGDYKLEILWPPKNADFLDTNDYSIIIKLTVGSKTFLFTGDAPINAIQQANPGHIDVLKLSHHGSRTGTNDRLVQELSPTYAIASYALDNSYGHPMQSVLKALHKHSVEVWGTGANGTITLTCDGTTITISGEKNGSVVAPSSKENSNKSTRSRSHS